MESNGRPPATLDKLMLYIIIMYSVIEKVSVRFVSVM